MVAFFSLFAFFSRWEEKKPDIQKEKAVSYHINGPTFLKGELP